MPTSIFVAPRFDAGPIVFTSQEFFMRLADLHRAVARATGESVSQIKRHGFQPVDFTCDMEGDDTPNGPNMLDCDDIPSDQRNHAARLDDLVSA
jgi:hypothetical protein